MEGMHFATWRVMPTPGNVEYRRRMSYASLSLAVACLAAVAITAVPKTAHAADEAGTADWTKFYGAAVDVMKGKFVTEAPSSRRVATESETRSSTPGLGQAWFGVAPKMSVVARDWGEGYRLYGAPMALSDELRISRSTRMVLSRVRLGSGRITPFVQLGVGQWRIDTTALPGMRYGVEVATQSGFGIEAHLARRWDLVAEYNSTYFIRDRRDAQSVDSAPRVFGAAVFSRFTFD
jgi:hypothetical protein